MSFCSGLIRPALRLSRLLPPLFRLVARCPLFWAHGAGALVGRCFLLASPTQRRRIAVNLGRALGRPPTFAELATNAAETGRMMFELPFVWLRPLDAVLGRIVEVRGWDKVEALRAAGRPMIALTPHLGCFEIISLYIGSQMPMTVLYRPPKQTEAEPFLRAGRARGQIQLAPADLSGVRRLIKALRQGEATGLLPDQAPGNGEGIWLPFFGEPAYTMTLAARLSEVKGAAVLLFWGERIAGKGWRIHVEVPAEPVDGTIDARAAVINREVERIILRQPLQYLWAYNRYKVPAGVRPPPSSTTES
ncbi:MAG: lysophospholipid acyltransferase family protein [Uliginosibacterium sp.]|nr:lysophospholipid acyltransferase family protein [Uliginosibacterium sp.]